MPTSADFTASAIFGAIFAAALLGGCQAGNDPQAPDPVDTVAADAQSAPDASAAEESPEMNATDADADECGADKLGRWLNVLPTETVKTEIAEAVGHDRIRYIAPGQPVTMDLRPDRLNVETGEDGRIKLFRCG